MVDEFRPLPLSYFRVTPKTAALVYDAECRRWRAIRSLYWVFLVTVFAPVVIFSISNLIKFGKFTSLSPADFVQDAQNNCVPTVRAIKKYQRDTGQLPDDLQKLVPRYLASDPSLQNIEPEGFVQYSKDGQRIIYDFSPSTEGWSVKGPFANGPLPLPKVSVGP